jgi:hypothetical protein
MNKVIGESLISQAILKFI